MYLRLMAVPHNALKPAHKPAFSSLTTFARSRFYDVCWNWFQICTTQKINQLLMEPWSTKEKKNKKAWFRDNYFHFQIFETFEMLPLILWLYCLLVKTLTYYRRGSKCTVVMPLHQVYFWTRLYSCIRDLYHLYSSKNVKNTDKGVLLLVK